MIGLVLAVVAVVGLVYGYFWFAGRVLVHRTAQGDDDPARAAAVALVVWVPLAFVVLTPVMWAIVHWVLP